VYDVQEESSSRVYGVELPGHRSDVRVAILNQDNTRLLTSSHNAVKVWNPKSGVCLHTVESGYGLSGVFLPGSNHAIIGTKAGKLEIIDIRAAERTEEVEAHLGAVWSISPLANGTGFVSGSADHDVKFWEYEFAEVITWKECFGILVSS
jgi:U3 small nucleolar RNA-associated protein 12